MFNEIKLNFPNIWIQDTDPFRIIDIIISVFPHRSYYVLHPDLKFSKYVDNTWKPVLVENPLLEETGEAYITTDDPSLIDHYFSKNPEKDTFITYFKVLSGPSVASLNYQIGLYFNSYQKYRSAFWSDVIEDAPLQTVIISPQACPDEYRFCFHLVDDVDVTQQEYISVLEHINNVYENVIPQESFSQISRAATGLKESDFIFYCLSSVVENSTVTPKYINDKKMATIKANGILEIISPKITFDQIGGLDNIKDIIKRTAKLRQNPEIAKAHNITPIRRILMVGVPGTGKSAICQATSAELNLDLARTGISQVMNSYIGQSEANMRAVFRQIKAMSPLCVWIDEFGRDLSGGTSSSHVDGGTTDRVHGEFLTGLQELPEESFLLCAANDLSGLKPEMLRADRFDKIFFVGLPSFEERKHILKINLSSNANTAYDYDALAEATAFMTGAEIVSLIRETKFYVISDTLRSITTQDILARAPQMRNTVWQKHPDFIKSMYDYALSQWDWASTSQMEDAKIILGKQQTSKPKLMFK